MIIRTLTFLLIGYLSTNVASGAEEDLIQVPLDGKATVTLVKPKLLINVTVNQRIVRSWPAPAKEDIPTLAKRSCPEWIRQCSLIEKIDININKTALPVPLSAFLDLFNVKSVKLTANGDIFCLILHGADAADSYIATIIFNKERVISRRLMATELDEITEETTYKKQKEFFDR